MNVYFFLAFVLISMSFLVLVLSKVKYNFRLYYNIVSYFDRLFFSFVKNAFFYVKEKSGTTDIKSHIVSVFASVLDDLSRIAGYFEYISKKASIYLVKKSRTNEKNKKAKMSGYIKDLYEHKKRIKINGIN